MPILQQFDVALRQFQETLKLGSLPVRRPATQDPTFWGTPINQYKIEPLNQSALWTNFHTLLMKDGFTATVTSLVATTFGNSNTANVEFRLIRNGQLMSNFDFAQGAEYNKQQINGGFPTQGRWTNIILQRSETLVLQVRNSNVTPQLILAGFNGFYSDTPDSASQGLAAGVVDA